MPRATADPLRVHATGPYKNNLHVVAKLALWQDLRSNIKLKTEQSSSD